MISPVFVQDTPALLLGKILIIGDIHIGVEREYRDSGLYIPSQTGKILENVKNLVEKTRAKKIIILGDVKHNIPGTSSQEERDIPVFLEKLSEYAEVEVIPGNHDGDLKRILPEKIKLHPSKGIGLDDIYLIHGHTWPEKEFLKAKILIMAHIHFHIEFKDKLRYRWTEPVWVKTVLDKRKIAKRFGEVKKLPRIIIIPAFNRLVGGMCVNKETEEKDFISPVFRCCDKKISELYLLDGTYLGMLKNL